MDNYKIFETEELSKRVKKLAQRDASFIRNKLSQYVYPQLKEEPCFGKNIKKLRGYDPPTWRYRIGNFRLFYIIDQTENIIYILTIEARKGAYK